MNERETTEKILTSLHRNVTSECDILTSVLPMIDDKFLISSVTAQLERYSKLANRAEDVMNSYGIRPKKPSVLSTAMMRGGVFVSTVFDSSDSHIAEMIERGTRRSADELEREMIEAGRGACDERALRLCRDVIDYERREADSVRDFI